MASQKLLSSNAKKSSGPKTASGKKASSRNAQTHGLTSAVTVLPDEDQVAFEDLRARFVDDYAPHGGPERFLVEQMVHHAWRLIRARALEDMLDAYDRTMWEIAAIEARERELSCRMNLGQDEGDEGAWSYASDEDIRRKDELLQRQANLVQLGPIMRIETEGGRERLARHEDRHLNALIKLMNQFHRHRAYVALPALRASDAEDGEADR